jgi:hypothetical protein
MELEVGKRYICTIFGVEEVFTYREDNLIPTTTGDTLALIELRTDMGFTISAMGLVNISNPFMKSLLI